MRECFVEELEALFLDLLEIVFRSLSTSSGILKVLFGGLESALDAFKPLDGSHVGCHAVHFFVQGFDLLLQLVVELLVGILKSLN